MEFPAFRISCYRFTVQMIDEARLPHNMGSTLRGGFGYAFKKMVCAQPDWRACTPCNRGNECPYGYIFETTRPEDSEVLRSLREIPLPFVIEPPLQNKQTYQAGDLIHFNVTLIGRAENYLPYFLLAFQELGKQGIGANRGRYMLQRILAIHPWQKTDKLVFDGVDVNVGGPDLAVTNQDITQRLMNFSNNSLKVEFLTPTILVHQQQMVAKPEFHTLFRGLLRRFSSLVYFHCGERWLTDYSGWITEANNVLSTDNNIHWKDFYRYSTRQKRTLNMGGFVGNIRYQGELEAFLPLLILGEVMHVGKATVFGNGQYRIVP